MKYCSMCGSADLERAIPHGDVGLRYICRQCGYTHYLRHNIVAGCLVANNDQVLLCRRAIDPGRGRWTIPAGYLEIGETLEEGARRETLEETGARVGGLKLFAVYNLPTFGEIYVIFTCSMLERIKAPGSETLEMSFVTANEVPWDSLAFPMVREALRAWVTARASTAVHTADFIWGPDGAVRVLRPHFEGDRHA